MERTSVLELRIDWSDLDLLGHVNNVAISGYMQASRIQYMDQVGLRVFPCMKTGPILASAHVDFLVQLHFPGQIRIITRCDRIGTKSLRLLHELYNSDGILAARSTEIIVCYDFEHQCSIPVPPEVRQAIGESEPV